MLRIALVGDIHGQWQAPEDTLALQALGVDLVLFVGDFGNEEVGITQAIAELPLRKAVILGNHDGWYTVTDWGRKKCPYDPNRENRVRQQLDLLGGDHVGYGRREFPELGLAVVGARPFSWGGQDWKQGSFYLEYYGVESMEASGIKIAEAIAATTCPNLILLGHNGPYGLGADQHDPCGRDWQPVGGDHGDPDFASALAYAYTIGKHIPLVAFGHMHHQLRHSPVPRRSIAVNEWGTVFVNGAIVPRLQAYSEHEYLRCFTLITLGGESTKQYVRSIDIVWLDPAYHIMQTTNTYTCVPPLASLCYPN
ncbi:MAG: TIGR04168 family protein [Pseudanabaenaceae cyanobacterium]